MTTAPGCVPLNPKQRNRAYAVVPAEGVPATAKGRPVTTDWPSLKSAVTAACDAGEDVVALDALRAHWQDHVAEHGVEIRGMLESLSPELWQDDPELVTAFAASYRCVGTASRSAALPYFDAAERMLDSRRPPAPALAAVTGLHHAAALRSLGRFDDAIARLEAAVAALDSDTTETLGMRIRLETRLALQRGIAVYHLGDFDEAKRLLRISAGLAGANLTRTEQLECLSVLALVEYSRGEFAAAQRYTEEAHRLAAGTDLAATPFGAGTLICETLLSVEKSRLGDARARTAELPRATARSEWEALGHYATATVSVITGEYVQGIDLLRRASQLYSGWPRPGFVHTVAEGLRATYLLRLGDTETAWSLFGSLEPTQHHANCPARFIASLRFSTGDARGALAALQSCEQLGEQHSSRTYVDVLLLKGAAHAELGNPVVAEVAIDRGLLLAAKNGMRLPFRLLPERAAKRLFESAASRPQPPEVLDILADVQGSPSRHGWSDLEPLSERERDIVQYLGRDMTVAEIASHLYISNNTVKTHLRSIYRKLGASSREDALRRSRELGLQADITRR